MDDLSGVGADGKRAVIVALTRLNGFFHDVYQGCLAERLLQAPNGAVAVWSSTDLSESGAHAGLAAAFAKSAQTLALGEAVRQARIATGGAGRAMVLLGDPTLFGRPSNAGLPPLPPTGVPTKGVTGGESAQSGGCGCALADRGGRSEAFVAIVALLLAAARGRRRNAAS
jgi:MYXO-CTERM domain-containing protein